VTFSEPRPAGVGLGIAFDGQRLWYSCFRTGANPDVYQAGPLTGNVLISYTVAGCW